MRPQDVNPGLRSPAKDVGIAAEFCNATHHTIPIPGHSFPIHVAGKHNKTFCGQTTRPALRMIVETGASVYNQNSRTGAW
jgi:hypothetical protein